LNPRGKVSFWKRIEPRCASIYNRIDLFRFAAAAHGKRPPILQKM
jgi:hypothetical protein